MSSSIIICQTYFNEIGKFGFTSLIFTESTWKDDTLYIFATAIDSELVKHAVMIKSIDGLNNVIINNISNDSAYTYNYFNKGAYIDHDTVYQIGHKEYEIGSEDIAVIQKLDLNGKILSEVESYSYYYPNDIYCAFKDFLETERGFIISEVNFRHHVLLNDSQICLSQYGRNFNLNWRHCYGNNSQEISTGVLEKSNKDIINVGYSTNLYNSDIYHGEGSGFWKGYIFQTDSLGNLEWEWRSNSKFESANAAYLENDSFLIVAAGYGIEQCTDPPTENCRIFWTGGIYKMNLNNRNKVWETSLSGGPYTIRGANRYVDIIPSIDGDGYILCGAGYDIAYEGCQQVDTTNKCWSFPGVIAKVSNSGDSIWLRKYFGVRDIYESNTLYDVEITPDSGYSFIGEAINPWPGDSYGQHGWVLKTDDYGCLVPGCHLISSEQNSGQLNLIQNETIFRVYPNPVIDYLSVLITKEVETEVALVLYDVFGTEIERWWNFERDATYLLPFDGLPSGTYILCMRNNHRILESKTVIKL